MLPLSIGAVWEMCPLYKGNSLAEMEEGAGDRSSHDWARPDRDGRGWRGWVINNRKAKECQCRCLHMHLRKSKPIIVVRCVLCTYQSCIEESQFSGGAVRVQVINIVNC